MGSLDGKTALVFGISNDHSLGWGVAQALHREGAKLGIVYTVPALEKRVVPLAESLGVDFVEYCDITSDASTEEAFAKAKKRFGTVDSLVHSMAYSPREDLQGRFLETSREGFVITNDISVYSLIAMARYGLAVLPRGGSILAMTYFGSEKVVPKYNIMGVAKAALEATVRYLAWDLGREGIRVNAISSGPIRTLAASGLSGFRKYQKEILDQAPLEAEPVNIGDIGNAAAFLCSPAARVITGEILFVDSGYNIMGMAGNEDDPA
jgi:enoyl-[acyl-carrier protein] reductase I